MDREGAETYLRSLAEAAMRGSLTPAAAPRAPNASTIMAAGHALTESPQAEHAADDAESERQDDNDEPGGVEPDRRGEGRTQDAEDPDKGCGRGEVQQRPADFTVFPDGSEPLVELAHRFVQRAARDSGLYRGGRRGRQP